MIRTWLGRALAAALFVLPLCAQSAPTSDCLHGRARGAWDLPAKDRPGFVRGILADELGRRFALEARLRPGEAMDGVRGGLLEGTITRLTADGLAGRPIAEVHGTFVVTPERTGRFEAGIVRYSDDPSATRIAMGKMAGGFADPMLRTEDPVGRFAARWALCR